MKKAASSPTRWFATWRTKPESALDAADLGTAFGLDMSIPDDDGPPPQPATPPAAQGWRQRFVLRRKAA